MRGTGAHSTVGRQGADVHTRDGGAHWRELDKKLPTIAVRDLVIQEREHDLVAATFGRGGAALAHGICDTDQNKTSLSLESL